ncbi:hypothetical protein ACFQ08_43760 [Streptosporangium algeriense]|uniref:Resolvase/invertase-type recombinase catalytic domain-containing protein n=1 Tax=Streptosporangium algeriense TaxID=1682748 RepID=A0ABW3E5W9_9ACTN
MRRLDDNGKPAGHLVHGLALPAMKKCEDAWLESDRQRGMTRSARDGYDRRPAPANRRP